MARLSKDQANEKHEKFTPRQCADCGSDADVHIGEYGFCCDHYAMRVAHMRRNADKRNLDGNIYRDPTGKERDERKISDAAYFKRVIKMPPPEIKKARETIVKASSFAARFKKMETER